MPHPEMLRTWIDRLVLLAHTLGWHMAKTEVTETEIIVELRRPISKEKDG